MSWFETKYAINIKRDNPPKENLATLALASLNFINIGEARIANIPAPPRNNIRSVIPSRICTKPESNAKEKNRRGKQ